MAEMSSTTSAEEHPLFSMDVFWEKRKRGIIFGAIALVILGVGICGWLWFQHHRKTEAIRAFASAKSLAELEAVASRFSETPVAGNARLLVAARERIEGNLDASNAAYEAVLAENAKYSLKSAAALGLAENAQFAGKESAVELFQQAAVRFPNSYIAPFALFNEGEAFLMMGNREAAIRVFRNLVTDYPNVPSAQLANMQLQRLNGLRKVKEK